MLHVTPDQIVSLGAWRGRQVVLDFYPADWCPVCGEELALYNALLPKFERAGASVAGISVDGPWSHVAYATDRKLWFPLLFDFEPKGAVAPAYGVYRETDRAAGRGVFVVDSAGVIRWSYLPPAGVQPGVDGVLTALACLATGKNAG